MAERRFGPTRAPGVVIIEKEAQQAIEPGALGTTAYTGILQKGPIGRAFVALNASNFRFRAGGIISESLLPDAAFDFFNLGNGAGTLWLNRITDGNEKKSALTVKNRRDPRGDTIQFDAGNGGRWGGKKQLLVDEYGTVTPTTVTLSNPPVNLKIDELVGGKVKFNAIPGKSFDIISNTATGELLLPSDVDVVAELGASLDKLISVELLNNGLALGVLIKDGQDNPLEEWGLEVHLIEGGIATLAKQFQNLSSDPNSPNYFVKTINDDFDSDFLLKATDLHLGSISSDIRPSNVFGKSLSLTDTVLQARIHDEVVSSVGVAKAKVNPLTPGGSVVQDQILLTVTIAGARSQGLLTFPGNPADGDAVEINGKTITFRSAVAIPDDEVLIGASAEDTLDNLVAFINSSADPLLIDVVFAEKASSSTMNLFAQTAGTAGDAISTTSTGGGGEPTWGAATLTGGIDQVWDYTSQKMPFLTGLTAISGVPFVAPNDFGAGFTIVDISKDFSKNFAIGDTLTVFVTPLEVGKLVGGTLTPNVVERRIKFRIIGNTADTITVKAGSQMTNDASVGDNFRVEYIQELGGGYDGIAEIADVDFVNAYDTDTSPLKGLRGRNLGLVKLATPGVTASSIQSAGASFAESQNWQYRYEIPANITAEDAADQFINETVGKNDFAVVQFPSFAKVQNPSGSGLKLTSQTGAIHGREAKIANDFQGFHKAAAGVDVILSNVVALPDGFEGRALDEEFLDAAGINMIKFKDGNFILWGDENVGNERRFKHKREYLSHVENVFLENFDFIIFSINDEQSDKLLESTFRAFFIPEFAKRAIRGVNLDDAVQIKIDAENNTDLTRSLGQKHAEIRLRIADTTKQFIITVSELGVTESVAA
ncbi:MAG: hypothetical protein COT73_05660 [Bdellovibrio sp. CG10_big_fil_rev_8_21_14_0_10_47_8]|nr:MAG: hypothetical protein COT73_05660 [Bdellovibrio sp. CG10_big_fil_rev_8_21_14_0_10_47_8]